METASVQDGPRLAEASDRPGAGVGAVLRGARLNRGEDLSEVAAALRIRLPYLEALEDGRIADLPGVTYGIGFVRAYSGYLGLDTAEIVARFKDEARGVNTHTQLQFPEPLPGNRVPGAALLLIVLLLAGGVYGGWLYASSEDRTLVELVESVPERLSGLTSEEEETGEEVPTESPAPEASAPPPGTAGLVTEGLETESAAAPPEGAEQALREEPAAADLAATAPADEQRAAGTAETAPPEAAETATPEAEPATETQAPRESSAEAPANDGAAERDPAAAETGSAATETESLPDTGAEEAAAATQAPTASESEPAAAADRGIEGSLPSAAPPEPDAAVEPVAEAPLPAERVPPPPPEASSTAGEATTPTGDVSQQAEAGLATEAPEEAPDQTAGSILSEDLPPPEEEPAAVEEPAEPAPAASETAVGPDRIIIQATRESFIQIVAEDGTVVTEKLMLMGEIYRVPPRTGLVLNTGNAGALKLLVNGVLVPPLGDADEIVRGIPLNSDALLPG
jgi:cytoskeleton protein RodZ